MYLFLLFRQPAGWNLADRIDKPNSTYKIEHMSDQWIRASEISTYVYCRRAWWLRRRQGVKPLNGQQLTAGSEYHAAHGQLVGRAAWLKRTAVALLLLVFAVWLLGVLV